MIKEAAGINRTFSEILCFLQNVLYDLYFVASGDVCDRLQHRRTTDKLRIFYLSLILPRNQQSCQRLRTFIP